MRLSLLITRPDPAGDMTAQRLQALGVDPVQAPLFDLAAVEWRLPETRAEAVLITSANALRFGGPALAQLTHLPCIAVGPITARAAEAAGFRDVIAGNTDIVEAVALAAARGLTALLHLAGRDDRAFTRAGMTIERVILYEARAIDGLDAQLTARLARGEIDWTLCYSPRAAAHFAALADQHGIARNRVAIAALSPAVAAAAGSGWRDIRVAAMPSEDSLFAAIPGLCKKIDSEHPANRPAPEDRSDD